MFLPPLSFSLSLSLSLSLSRSRSPAHPPSSTLASSSSSYSSIPFRVLFLSVLRRFSLFFRPARSLKTGSRASNEPAGRPAGRSVDRPARTRIHSLARVSHTIVLAHTHMSPVSACPYVFYSADVRTRVPLVREYSEPRSRTAYIYVTHRYNVTIGDRYLYFAGGKFSGSPRSHVT